MAAKAPLNTLRVGCSGWMYDSWRGRLYPEREPKRRWLELYAQHFDTVEVNSTFYRLARPTGVAGWVAQTPPNFLFAVKASRYLTHVKRLGDIREGIARFYEPLEPLLTSAKMGPVLWQLPENFHRDDGRLAGWLELLPPGRHTIEFRHPSWFVPEVMERLRSHQVALTIGDHPQRPFQSHEATASWRFVRFHYGARGRAGNYSVSELEEWAGRIARWPRSEELYIYFNNDWNSYAPANAKTLLRRLQAAGTRASSTGSPKRSRTSSRSKSSR
ncbi:MAG: DUF72 domain-containing protein [Solirubrobacteraceae bacterium]